MALSIQYSAHFGALATATDRDDLKWHFARTTTRGYQLLLIFLLTSTLVAAASQTACSNTQTPQQIDARIDSLIQQMSLEERVAKLQDRAPAVPRLGLLA
jgi:hypothetical protein